MDDFEQFAAAVAPSLHRFGWLLTHDRHASEDLVQETLARVYVVLRRGRRIDEPAAYARTVLARLHLDERRRRRSTEIVTAELPQVSAPPADLTASVALRSALAGMDRVDRTVLVMRYYLDLTVAETAREIGISDGAVRVRSSRAAARLRTRLGPDFRHGTETDIDTAGSRP